MNPRARKHFDQAGQILDGVYKYVQKAQEKDQNNIITEEEKKDLLDNCYLNLRIAEIHLQASAIVQQSDT